ncbi:MAG: DUF362 domain-containing protein [Promethearchaeota archaeon]
MNGQVCTRVELVEGYDDAKTIKKAIKVFFMDYREFFEQKTVILKVSFVFPLPDPEKTLATNTNPKLIALIAEVLESDEFSVKKILIADGDTLGTARYTFAVTPMKKYVKKLGKTKLMFLDEVAHVKKDVRFNGKKYVLRYPRDVLKDDVVLISVPKLKINIFANVTLSVKNNMGFIPKSNRLEYHQEHALHGMISALYLIRPPDFVIVDAIVAGQGQGPMLVDPVQTNALIMSNNGIAADLLSLYLMGITEAEYPDHVKMLCKHFSYRAENFGLNLTSAGIVKEIKANLPPFSLPSTAFDDEDDNIESELNLQVFPGKSKKGIECKAGCLGFVRTILSFYSSKYLSSQKGRKKDERHRSVIILGCRHDRAGRTKKDIESLVPNTPNTILFGDCAILAHGKMFKKARKFKGCPPDYVKVLLGLHLKGNLKGNPWFSAIPKSRYISSFFAGKVMKFLNALVGR